MRQETLPTSVLENLKCSFTLFQQLFSSNYFNSSFPFLIHATMGWEAYDRGGGGSLLPKATLPPQGVRSSHTKLAPHSYHAKIIIVIIWMRQVY